LSFISWLSSKLGGSVPANIPIEYTEEYLYLFGDVYFRELARWSCINLVANALSKCEIRTFVDKKEVKADEYYLWNVEPNKNQNSSEFMHQLIAQLYSKFECLVIESNKQLLVADSFNKTPYALYEDIFSQVSVKGFTFDRSFLQSEVLYFKLSETNMRRIADGIYESYSKLIAYTMRAYQKSRGRKGIFKYDAIPVKGTREEEIFNDLINNKIKKWMEGDNAALPLGKGHSWDEMDKKTYSSESTRDIRAMIDDIFDFTALGLGIPPSLVRGDVQDTSKAVEQLLTFCIDPLVDLISEEINRKRVGRTDFLKGTYTMIDTKAIKHVDLLSVATSIDKLVGSGAFCINDILRVCGEPEIDEPWANEHFLTKNYSTIEEALKVLGMSGGDNTG